MLHQIRGGVLAVLFNPRHIQQHFDDLYEDLFYELSKASFIIVDFSPVTDFREATCRQYEENTCNRGGYCNFMHLKKISSNYLVGIVQGVATVEAEAAVLTGIEVMKSVHMVVVVMIEGLVIGVLGGLGAEVPKGEGDEVGVLTRRGIGALLGTGKVKQEAGTDRDWCSGTAMPAKKYQPSLAVISFFTAVAVEVPGALKVINADTARNFIPFVLNGVDLNANGGSDHKAGALMISSVLANRSALSSDLIKNLIATIDRIAQKDAKEFADLPWLRTSLMAIISLVQSQSIQMFPKKAVESLNEIRC
ncbi:hypothetical protein MKW98_008296 [Papaver atlanticum]|uniref:C3H1-type domain-containing protein n=1 Tax=Papaver atlanticum TaxID=357466 RepID=A0AAD4S9F7_9MAGN|nr:hypothetical protein MKW98_008296 [Papaver atlanticum]